MDASYGRDIFYEESAISNNAKKGERKYKIMHIFSMFFLVLGILLFFFFVLNMPFGTPNVGSLTAEEAEQLLVATEMSRFIALFCLFNSILFLSVWFILFKLKARVNISYDYVFVSGELRISKVININKRKLVARFDSEEILQIGDIDNKSYELLKTDPTNKEVVCTPNYEAADGKFFMYIYINDNGKKLYILECREQMLVNILKFAKRTALEKDYVMQEKKQKVK